ncbi:hypothetical protein CEY11_22700 [Candidimonas nitroreducens]|uniref:Uncharacterized protein n=1 Tax=Candidimonas nitroreducens TaxID=683354 RepID=A0A225M5I3_9BURK|nr:hypothetical protein CEY11_22700 [Candidimonas nitroreducens]
MAFFIVDELHAFVGTDRGKQLQSLIHRIEHILGIGFYWIRFCARHMAVFKTVNVPRDDAGSGSPIRFAPIALPCTRLPFTFTDFCASAPLVVSTT